MRAPGEALLRSPMHAPPAPAPAAPRPAARRRSRAVVPASARAGSVSTTVTCAAGDARQQGGAVSRPTTPAPMTSMRSPASGAASHSTFSAVSMLAASTARGVGTASGTGMHIAVGRQEDVLMRMQCEDPPRRRRCGRPRCSRISPGTGTRPPISGARIAWYWLAGTRPANTSDSVPRETPLARVRTSSCPGTSRRQCLVADFAVPGRHGPERARLGHVGAPGRIAGERDVEQQIRAEPDAPTSRSAALGDARRLRQGEGRNARADQQRRDRHVQPVEAPAARKRETVMPPPSTKMRVRPRPASARARRRCPAPRRARGRRSTGASPM